MMTLKTAKCKTSPLARASGPVFGPCSDASHGLFSSAFFDIIGWPVADGYNSIKRAKEARVHPPACSPATHEAIFEKCRLIFRMPSDQFSCCYSLKSNQPLSIFDFIIFMVISTIHSIAVAQPPALLCHPTHTHAIGRRDDRIQSNRSSQPVHNHPLRCCSGCPKVHSYAQ